ncbi:hypothetical protein BH10PSE1_BH10PSE1_29980 [soil metagenome]
MLIREGEAAARLFNITAGSLRVYKLLPDGRRQITGFLFAGDCLGLAIGDTYVFSAEAMEPSTVWGFRKGAFRALVERSPPLEHMLLQRTSHELAAAQNQMLLLGRKTAIERLASFLLDLPGHDPARSTEPGHGRLPMKRGEIADYLGLTIETVSRPHTNEGHGPDLYAGAERTRRRATCSPAAAHDRRGLIGLCARSRLPPLKRGILRRRRRARR